MELLLFENVLPQEFMQALIIIVVVIVIAVAMDEIVESLVCEGEMDDRRNVLEF